MTAVTYLEFTDGSSHKFYEVSVLQQTLTLRFGRVNTQGTTQVKTYATPEKAQTEAHKRIREKQRKGYQVPITTASAVPVDDASQPTPPAVVTSNPVKTSLNIRAAVATSNPVCQPSLTLGAAAVISQAPILWQFDSGSSTFGLAIEAEHCWLGNEKGQVFKLDQQGHVLQQYQLPDAVKCIVIDDIWIYVGCDNGNVYDLTGKFPYLAYELEKGIDIFWLAIYDGMLGVSDANGTLSKTDPEGEVLWTRLSSGKMGWMLCCDRNGFYHGHTKGVTMYDFDTGRQVWHQPTLGKVLFGCLRCDRLFVATSGKQIQSFTTTGETLASYACSASVYACTTDDQGQYLFASDSSAFIYCFSQEGQLLWKVSTGCGSALSIQYFQDRLYWVTNQGVMACLDISRLALHVTQSGVTQSGTLPTTGTGFTPPNTVEVPLAVAAKPDEGVILECFRQGPHLRVRAISDGYHSDWMVQFPRDIRREGDRYWVTALKESKQGGYYRVYGEIQTLDVKT